LLVNAKRREVDPIAVEVKGHFVQQGRTDHFREMNNTTPGWILEVGSNGGIRVAAPQ
jgi:hypothetical protein